MKLNSRSKWGGWISDSKAMRTCASHDNAIHSCPTHETCTHVPYVVTCTCAPTYDSQKHMYLCMTEHTHTHASRVTKPHTHAFMQDKARTNVPNVLQSHAPMCSPEAQSSSAPSQLRHSSWHLFATPQGGNPCSPKLPGAVLAFLRVLQGSWGRGCPQDSVLQGLTPLCLPRAPDPLLPFNCRATSLEDQAPFPWVSHP